MTSKPEQKTTKQRLWDNWDQKVNETQTQQPSTEVAETKTTMILWNQKPLPTYKLRHYNYYKERPDIDFLVQYYIKFNQNSVQPPLLNKYTRFHSSIYETELGSRSNKHYSSLMQEPSISDNLIFNKQYYGHYSHQQDYAQFKYDLQLDKEEKHK